MNKAQISKLVGACVLLAVSVILILSVVTGDDKGSAPSRVTLINVITGEVVKMRASKIAGFPVVDDEGRPCLFPAQRNDDGEYVVQARFLTADRFEQFDQLAINPDTGSLLE
ncbi:MAG: hypothetical protein AAGB34_00430 [Planctomycetota bacterium]